MGRIILEAEINLIADGGKLRFGVDHLCRFLRNRTTGGGRVCFGFSTSSIFIQSIASLLPDWLAHYGFCDCAGRVVK